MKIYPLTPVSHNVANLQIHPYSCQNILLCHCMIDHNGTLSKAFPHGYAQNDKCSDVYHDRLDSNDFAKILTESGCHNVGGLEQWARTITPEQLMNFGNKFAQKILQYPEDIKVTSVRIIRTTNVSNGYPIYRIQCMSTLPENIEAVSTYRNPDIEQVESGTYDVDSYGNLVEWGANDRGVRFFV